MLIANLKLDEYEFINIKSVIKTNKIVKMNDIQVEDNETFFISNGILTHNSAIASFTEIRNPETQAGMPLRGKVLNVYGKAPIDAMENAEVADIVTAINLEFNEQMGDWIIQPNVKIYEIKYESFFEVDDDGNSIVKNVVVLGTDKFHLNKRWFSVDSLVNNPTLYRGYIDSIKESEKGINELTDPDYFHFRRLWEFRGFRKSGIPFEVTIGKSKFVCNDIDEIMVDGVWKKVSLFMKKPPKSKQVVSIEKVKSGTELTRFHKYLKPSYDTKLNFSKVYIATDADPDGSAIHNLLINLFHEYFPELFWDKENPFVSRIIFPMIAVTKGKNIKYYANREKFEEQRKKDGVDDSWKVTYFKGLGSMEKKDWEHVFSDLDTYSFSIDDDGYLDELMQIFFDGDASLRKEWLSA